MEHAARRGGSGRLPLRRRFQAVFAREHGSHRSRRRSLRHRAAAHPLGGRRFSQMDPNQHARLDLGVGSPSSPLRRRTARPLVGLSAAIAVGGRLDRRLRSTLLTLPGPRTRLRRAADIDFQIKTILEKHHVARYLKVERTVANTTSTSRHGPADRASRRPIARSSSDASTSNGRSIRRPSPTSTRATACIL
jgi:hypothetical protein